MENSLNPGEDARLLPIQLGKDFLNQKDYNEILQKFKKMSLSQKLKKSFRFIHTNASNGVSCKNEIIVDAIQGYTFSITAKIECAKCNNYRPHHEHRHVCGNCSPICAYKEDCNRSSLKIIFTNEGKGANVIVKIGVESQNLAATEIICKKYKSGTPGTAVLEKDSYFQETWEFKSANYLSFDGSIAILCDIAVLNKDSKANSGDMDFSLDTRLNLLPFPTQLKRLADQFTRDNINPVNPEYELGDVILVVGKNRIHCHKFVLSMSSNVFKAIFSFDMSENKNCEIPILDHDLDTIISLLSYCYGRTPPRFKLTPELLAASDVYEVTRLREMCIQKLLHGIEWENVANIWSIAYLHNIEELSYSAVAFMAKNWNMLSEDREVQNLVQSYPNLLLVISKLLSEDQLRTTSIFDQERKISMIR